MCILEFNLQNFMINIEDLFMSGSRKKPVKSETPQRRGLENVPDMKAETKHRSQRGFSGE